MNDSREGQLRSARRIAVEGRYEEAEQVLQSLFESSPDSAETARIASDLGAISAVRQRPSEARRWLEQAREHDPACRIAGANLDVLDAVTSNERSSEPKLVNRCSRPRRVAILSLLFNWPSTGGGTVHTTETAKFLSLAGYQVRHFSARFSDWRVGLIGEPPPFPVTSIDFAAEEWNAETIRRKFRHTVDEFAPDAVIITDSWNTKPLLAEAVRGYRFFLRLAAQECLCPLNNLRLLIGGDNGRVATCPRNQLATPDVCRRCVATNGRTSGGLHRAERELAGFDGRDYIGRLHRTFAEAEGVLVVNPLIAAMVAPFARRVEVIPSGFDPARFPWPWPDTPGRNDIAAPSIVYAGVHDDFIKGYHVLQAACDRLWSRRHDFQLVVTSDPPEDPEPYAQYVGWQSQAGLPAVLRKSDIVVFPTVAEDALGRTAVEAMAVGRPVVASRIGGLPFTVTDGLTGLLFEPGNPDDLGDKLARLLDDGELRERLGAAGREQFEQRFEWPTIIEQCYVPLLGAADLRPRFSTAVARDEDEPACGAKRQGHHRPADHSGRAGSSPSAPG